MYPETHEVLEAKLLCDCFLSNGYEVFFRVKENAERNAHIIIAKSGKSYRFSDPDWKTVNKQLTAFLHRITVSS